jgi:predicted metalloprotease
LIILIVLVLISSFDFGSLAPPGGDAGDTTSPPGAGAPSLSAEQQQLGDFVSVVLADTEDTWHSVFRRQVGRDYVEPKLVLFSGAIRSACGFAQAAVGPFYCPQDRKVYIDLSFYDELRRRFKAPGDFAQAYVIAHEVGHHVQTLLGITQKVHDLRGRVGERDFNAMSVRLELQADCLAGVWAHHADRARNVVEPGDIDEALNAASAIGDDNIQRETQGRVRPESFTHGTSEQRQRWFRRGYEQASLDGCNTFTADRL